MTRVKGGTVTRRRHKKVLKAAKGYRSLGSKTYKQAKEKRMRAGQHSYAHRRHKKRNFRRLWITRLSAALRERGWKYSEFSAAISKKGMLLNRRVLSELAQQSPEAFDALVKELKK